MSPPVSLQDLDPNAPSAPPTYVYTQRREPQVGPQFLASPDDQFNEIICNNPNLLGLSMMQDAPDPIRQSYAWADGHKVQPWAHMRHTSQLRFSILGIMQDQFAIGKLPQYRVVPMYAGTQRPLMQRYNIQEGVSSTFGSQYVVAGNPSPGSLVLDTGMLYTQSQDGHPY
jgi:hypothetical protein